MKLETLYKRNKTGKIQYWKILTSIDEHHGSTIVKESGQLGTDKPLRHLERIQTGKNLGKANETTPEEQALSQAQSDWNKKRDEGYKSLTDLGIGHQNGGVHHGLFTIHGSVQVPAKSLEEVLDACLPEFNTDASGNQKPMKAPTTPWKAGKKLKWPQQIEPKLDGLRATLVIEGTALKPQVKFLSSSGKEYTALRHLVDTFSVLYNGPVPNILDGEVYCHGMTLEEINAAAKKLCPETLNLKYHLFDVPSVEESQGIRTDIVHSILKGVDHPMFPALDSRLIHSEDQIKPLHDMWVEQGYEGAMLKDPDGTYQFGQRSSYWNKVKMFDDDEFEVVGYELGQRGVQDLVFVCKCEAGTFNAQMNGSLASKQALYKQIDSLIGKQLTVKYFGLSKYGIPNLPKGKAFRDDL